MTQQFAEGPLQELEVASSDKSQLQPCYRQPLESVSDLEFPRHCLLRDNGLVITSYHRRYNLDTGSRIGQQDSACE